jgi:hypothetical protein
VDKSDPIAWLSAEGAQRDVIDGLRPIAGDWKTLWTTAPRGDWLLGIAVKLGIAHPLLVSAAAGCARIALADLDGELRDACAALLDDAEAFARTGEGADAIAERARSLEAAMARAPDPASEAAARAALAVGLGVADKDVLASAPAAAAEATILSTLDCGLAMAMRWAHDRCAAAVRTAIPWEALDAIVSRD